MKKRRTFWDDPIIGPKLDAIPENEVSTIIRMALRQWFSIATKPPEPLTPTDARLVARELMQSLRENEKEPQHPEGHRSS